VKTTINVTQEHIDKGKKGKCRECPIALAVQEKCISEISVGVISGAIFFDDDSHPASEMAVEAIRFVWAFDLNGKVEPFSFDLDIPDELLAEVKA
jgi:hypothetical protein